MQQTAYQGRKIGGGSKPVLLAIVDDPAFVLPFSTALDVRLDRSIIRQMFINAEKRARYRINCRTSAATVALWV